MPLLNGTETIITGLTNITGNLFLSLMVIIILLIILALALRIPLEFTAVLILPMLLTLMSYGTGLGGIFGALIIYLGIILGKHFFFK